MVRAALGDEALHGREGLLHRGAVNADIEEPVALDGVRRLRGGVVHASAIIAADIARCQRRWSATTRTVV